jgi:formamidopyrimidine-DNA glycosylase
VPELAEVYFYAHRWEVGLQQKILAVQTHPTARVFRGMKAARMAKLLRGNSLIHLETHGKQILLRFSPATLVGLHLGMTGELRVEPATFVPGRHDHLVLRQPKQCLVFRDPRMFGRIRFHQGDTPVSWWHGLPPGLLTPEFDLPRLTSILQRRQRAPLKALLLNQAYFLGLGNWMVDEILWRARLSPEKSANQLEARQMPALHKEIRWVANRAMKTIGQTLADPPATWLFPHRWRKGGNCPRCDHALSRQEIGGRTTCWCPQCQPIHGH